MTFLVRNSACGFSCAELERGSLKVTTFDGHSFPYRLYASSTAYKTASELLQRPRRDIKLISKDDPTYPKMPSQWLLWAYRAYVNVRKLFA